MMLSPNKYFPQGVDEREGDIPITPQMGIERGGYVPIIRDIYPYNNV